MPRTYPRVVIDLEALPQPVPPIVRLRMALKTLLRAYGLRARAVPDFDAEEFAMPRPPAVTTKPARRFTMRATIGADSLPALIRTLDEIRFYLATGGRGPKAGGGPDAGFTLGLVEDAAMTHSKYFEQLREWERAQQSPAARAA